MTLGTFTKANYVTEFVEVLFAPDRKRLDAMVKSLTDRNSLLKNKFTVGFMYQGTRHIPEEYKNYRTKDSILSLDLSLNDDLMKYVSEKRKLENDIVHIRQLFTVLVMQCANVQEVRDSMPECVIALTKLKNMPRKIQDPTFLIRSNEHHMYDYERLLPKIQMYSVANLLY